MRIVFVNPPLSLEERYGLKHRSGGETQPLGLAQLAAVTRSAEDTVKEIAALKPDVLGITAVTISVFNAAAICQAVKKKSLGILCVIGGHHFTSVPRETMERFPSFDMGIMGEGEEPILDLMNALSEDKWKEKALHMKSLVLRDNGDIVVNERRERLKDLDSLPMPAFDLLPDLSKYYSPPVHTVKRFPACNLVTSRGCPGKCTFCDRSVYGNKGACFSAEYVMRMIKILHNDYGINEIQFRDDNFLVFRKRLLELCRMLQEEKLDLVWTCLGRVDMVTPHVLEEMSKAGCWQMWFGLESGDNEILKTIKKGITTDQTEKAVRQCRDAGIQPCGSFIIGNPGETAKTIKKTIKFAKKLPLAEAHCCFLSPFPGSELYNDWEKYGSFDKNWRTLHGWAPVFVPTGMTSEELVKFNKKFFQGFYFRPRIVISYLSKIKTLNHLKVYFQGFLALLEWLAKSFKQRDTK